MEDPAHSAPWRLMRLLDGFVITQLLYVAAKLGVAEILAEQPRTGPEVASLVGADPSALTRVLRGLVIEEVLEQDDHGRFALGTLGSALIALRAPALARGEIYYGPAASLLECVLEGGTPYERATGDRFFDHLHRHPELEAVFHAGMAGRAEQEAADVVASFDFSGFSRLMDVGGGRGVLLATILKAVPTMAGVLVDREVALEQARTFLDEAGVGDRTECLPVDFFESVPGGADAYLLSARVARLGRCGRLAHPHHMPAGHARRCSAHRRGGHPARARAGPPDSPS